MGKALIALQDHYVEAEPKLIEQIRDTGIEVRNVDRTFFGDVTQEWEALWSDQKDVIDALRSEADAL